MPILRERIAGVLMRGAFERIKTRHPISALHLIHKRFESSDLGHIALLDVGMGHSLLRPFDPFGLISLQ